MSFLNRKKSDEHRSGRGLRDGLSLVVVVALALLLAWFIIAFVFESYQVDGPSMQNTLHNTDRLIVWKVPRTWAKITGHDYIPARGDIVIFKESGLAAYGDANVKQLVKRVIGLPGDHLVVKNGQVTIYNQQHPDGFMPKENQPPHGHGVVPTGGNIDITLRKDQLFMMGDNRPNSLDSRIFGPINANQIVGKLILRDFPLNSIKAF